MSPSTISFVVLAFVFGGSLFGVFLNSRLPEGHLDANSKDAVRLAMGLVGTTVALVLGLLIGSAKGFYDTQTSEVTQAAADIVVLNRLLVHYGPETKNVQALLRNSVAQMVALTWQRPEPDQSQFKPAVVSSESILDEIQQLAPQNDNQKLLQAQALSMAIKLGQTRWLMFAQKTTSIPKPLLVILVFWLTLLFVSFGLFIPPNTTVVISFFASALAVCGAIFLILEMYQPYGGLIQVSSAPLRAALAQLAQ